VVEPDYTDPAGLVQGTATGDSLEFVKVVRFQAFVTDARQPTRINGMSETICMKHLKSEMIWLKIFLLTGYSIVGNP
jgi:hypothetical protein